jgi:hypothetical protein
MESTIGGSHLPYHESKLIPASHRSSSLARRRNHFFKIFLILERMFRSRLLANPHMILHRGNATTVVLMKSRGGADEDTVVRSRGPHVWRTRRLAYSSKRPCVRAQAKQTAARASPGLG